MSDSRPRVTERADRLSRFESLGGWRGLAHRAYLAARRQTERLGVQLVYASYDSPIPRQRELAPELFERRSPMRGIDWDPEAQMRWVEENLAAHLAEFSPRAGDAPAGTFRLDNATYDRVDAELLYAMVRWAKPARVVELGSGYSTLLIAEALERNEAEGRRGELRGFDPYPSPHVLARPELAPRLRPERAQDIPLDVFRELDAGDVLFVDTSHTVKIGGDVNFIVLDVLPLLAPGVVVHFHDVFLPADYSRGHLEQAHFWTEQYLLQAFLAGNRDWEVLVGAQAVALHAPDRLGAQIASFRPGVSPGALWLRRARSS